MVSPNSTVVGRCRVDRHSCTALHDAKVVLDSFVANTPYTLLNIELNVHIIERCCLCLDLLVVDCKRWQCRLVEVVMIEG